MATLADFWVGDLIGEGSFGQVFLGKHKISDKYVAIKVIDKITLKKRPYLLDAALTEQRVLVELRDCDKVVNLWASFHDAQCLYLVMECATGGDLRHVIREGLLHNNVIQWRQQEVPHFGLMILEAIEQIHSKGIIHADLKPDNILITSRGEIQLADFGSAVVLPMKSNQTTSTKFAVTQVRGTAEFSCPEIIRGMQDLSVSADLWSFGCILFTMLTGESPFHAESEALVVTRIQSFTESFREKKAEVLIQQSTDGLLANTVLDTEWRFLIKELLHPDPLRRLGRLDFDVFSHAHGNDENQRVSYRTVRADNIWSKLVDSPQARTGLIPPEPLWWTKSRNSPMRDGSTGWMAFMF